MSELISIISGNGYYEFIRCGDFNLDTINYDNNENTLNFLNSLMHVSITHNRYKPSRITNETATLIDKNLLTNQTGLFPVFLSVKYRLINDSTIANLRQSLLCLDLGRIIGSDKLYYRYGIP